MDDKPSQKWVWLGSRNRFLNFYLFGIGEALKLGTSDMVR